MSLPTQGGFAPMKKVKYAEIGVGSKIEIEDLKGGSDTFLGTVIEFRPLFGPSSLPTLIVLPDGADAPVMITESGKWRVTVRVPAVRSSEFAPPAHLTHIRRRPTQQTAIRFTGGVHSAIEIIQWAAGRATIVYEAAVPGQRGESLLLPALEGDSRAVSGDWIIQSAVGERFEVVPPSVFAEEYDITQPPVPAVLAPQVDEGNLMPAAPAAMFPPVAPPVGGFLSALQ